MTIALVGFLAVLITWGLGRDAAERWRARARLCARLLNDRVIGRDLLYTKTK
jgi:hypothetical protein